MKKYINLFTIYQIVDNNDYLLIREDLLIIVLLK